MLTEKRRLNDGHTSAQLCTETIIQDSTQGPATAVTGKLLSRRTPYDGKTFIFAGGLLVVCS